MNHAPRTSSTLGTFLGTALTASAYSGFPMHLVPNTQQCSPVLVPPSPESRTSNPSAAHEPGALAEAPLPLRSGSLNLSSHQLHCLVCLSMPESPYFLPFMPQQSLVPTTSWTPGNQPCFSGVGCARRVANPQQLVLGPEPLSKPLQDQNLQAAHEPAVR